MSDKFSELLLGMLIGGAVAGSSAAFLNSKKGEELQHTAGDKLNDLKHELEYYLQTLKDKGENMSSDISDQLHDWQDKAGDRLESLTKLIESAATSENKEKLLYILGSGTLGMLLGVGLHMHHKHHEKNSGCNNASPNIACLLRKAVSIMDHSACGKPSESTKNSNLMSDALNLTLLGIRFWDKIKKNN